MAERSRRGGRPPDPAVDVAVRAAVLELLFERGTAMTFDEVAARAGVGRATLFRRFATKRDMILAAMASATAEQVRIPVTGTLRGDLEALLASAVDVFGDPGRTVMTRSAASQAAGDPAFAELFNALLRRRLLLFEEVLSRHVAGGDPSPGADAVLVADMLSGLLLLRLLSRRELPGADERARIVDMLMAGLPRAAVHSASEG